MKTNQSKPFDNKAATLKAIRFSLIAMTKPHIVINMIEAKVGKGMPYHAAVNAINQSFEEHLLRLGNDIKYVVDTLNLLDDEHLYYLINGQVHRVYFPQETYTIVE